MQQVFYVNDTKLGDNWRIVQRVHHRHLWDLVEQEDRSVEEISDTENRIHVNAFQRHDSNEAAIFVENQDNALEYLAREDVELDILNEEVLRSIMEQADNEVDFSEEEDETHSQHCDDEYI